MPRSHAAIRCSRGLVGNFAASTRPGPWAAADVDCSESWSSSAAFACRPLVPVESPDGSDADDGEFARRCAHAAAGGRVDGGGRRVAVEVTLPAEGVVVRDKRSGDVEMGSPRHGITTGACEKLLGSRIGRL